MKYCVLTLLLIVCGCASQIRGEIAETQARNHAAATENAQKFFKDSNGVVTDFPNLFDTDASVQKRMREARQVIETMQAQGASAGFLVQMQFYLSRMLSTIPSEDDR